MIAPSASVQTALAVHLLLQICKSNFPSGNLALQICKSYSPSVNQAL